MSALPAWASEPETDFAEAILDQIRREIQVEMEVIKEARRRRNLVKDIVITFKGMRRTYDSGSIAHGTAKNPLPDADGGGVLDRRSYPELGPDGGGVGPTAIVSVIAGFVMEHVREEYQNATCTITKRAIQISFNQPIGDEDPRVDLIVALVRANAPGIWIPNTERNCWDASDPEEHTRLLVQEPPDDLRVHRARLIRLEKVAVEQDQDQTVMISFNIEALALEHVSEVQGLAEGLRDSFWDAADDIAKRLTPDPAGVSPPIKLPEGITQETAARRLRYFGDRIAAAIEHRYDRARVEQELAEVFPAQLPDGPRSQRADFARTLRGGNTSAAVKVALGPGAERLKESRSYGGDAPV